MAVSSLRLYKTEEAATVLGVPARTLRRLRAEKRGPAYLKFGKRDVWYAHEELNRWIEVRRIDPAAQDHPIAA